METYLEEGMIVKPNQNNMEYYFGDKDQMLKIVQIGMDRVFAKDIRTGEYLGEIGNYNEIEYYYDVVKKWVLPKKMNEHAVPREIIWNGIENSMEWDEKEKIATQNNIEYTKQQYEKMGITILDEYDDLFWDVILPDGWEIRATNHCMWNDLCDDKKRRRAEFFCKGSFYDRDAFVNFKTRYRVHVDHVADPGSAYEIWKKSDFQGCVKDGENVIFTTERMAVTGSYKGDDKVEDILQKELDKFMEDNYPDYKNIHAYWD